MFPSSKGLRHTTARCLRVEKYVQITRFVSQKSTVTDELATATIDVTPDATDDELFHGQSTE
jgi:hypothetical protein